MQRVTHNSLRFLILLTLTAFYNVLYAQDLHYTQYNASPQNLNPAQTGLFDGDWRFASNYRTQWAGISVPFISHSLATDTRLKTSIKNSSPSLGLLFNADKSGDSKLTATQIFVSVGIVRKLDADSNHIISIALQPGFSTKSFNVNALTFDKQYDGNNYNSSLNTGENFTDTRIAYFDGGFGAAYIWRKTERMFVNVGASAFHLNRPKQSFFDNSNIKLDVKTTISALAEVPLFESISILPSVLYSRQGKYSETLLAITGKYYLMPLSKMTTALYLGLIYRNKDAANIVAAAEYKNLTIGMSYDINSSKLREASNLRGGFEMSLIYIFKKPALFVAKKRACPVYM